MGFKLKITCKEKKKFPLQIVFCMKRNHRPKSGGSFFQGKIFSALWGAIDLGIRGKNNCIG